MALRNAFGDLGLDSTLQAIRDRLPAALGGTGGVKVDVGSSALPTGAATSAKQSDGSQKSQVVDGTGNVVGTTGNALDVNIKSGSGSTSSNLAQVNGATVNVGTGTSGTGTQRVAVASDSSITANAGTNLNTSALALDATLTNATQQSKITDGTNVSNVVANDTGFNGLVTNQGTKTIAFTTSGTGAQVVADNTDCRGYASIEVVYTGVGSGLAATGQFAPNSGGTYISSSTWANPAANTTPPTSLGALSSTRYISLVADNFFHINVTALTSGTATGYIVLSTRQITYPVTTINSVKTNNTALGTSNLGVLPGLANAAQPSWSEGNQVVESMDLKGNQRMRISDAAGNDRGANVNASNQLSVSVDNSPTFTAAVGSPAFVTTTPSTTGGWTPSLKNGLSNTNSQVKSDAGTLGGWYAYNPNSTAAYIQIFDTATGSITVGTTTPKLSLAIPPLTGANIELTNGINFATAICVAATTTATNGTAPGTALDCNFWYK